MMSIYASLKTRGSPGFLNVNWPFLLVPFVDRPCLSSSIFLIAAGIVLVSKNSVYELRLFVLSSSSIFR